MRWHERHFAAEFILLERLAFGNAFDFRRVHALEHWRIVLLLRVNETRNS
jgi:hypothetical protein